MAYKSKRERELNRAVYYYDNRIETANKHLVDANRSNLQSMFVACHAITFEPIRVNEMGVIYSSDGIKGSVFKDEASADYDLSNMLKESTKFVGVDFVIIKLSDAIKMHIDWLEQRKKDLISTYAAVNVARNKTKTILSNSRKNLPWWRKI